MTGAVEDLERTASMLADRDTPPWEMLLMLSRRAELLRQGGAVLPAGIALRVVHALPGLADWQPLDSWQERMTLLPADAAASIETDDEEERERVRRAHVLAAWLIRQAGAPLVEGIVKTAQQRALELAT